MSLFLNNHPTAKIMILGRWESDAFLVYIRLQIFEWTSNMSSDVISFENFHDIGLYDLASPSNPRLRRKQPQNGLSSKFNMLKFNVDIIRTKWLPIF